MGQHMAEIMIMGASVGDVLVSPANAEMLNRSSSPAQIRMTMGGDALNESTALARLGHAAALGTVLGADAMARLIEAHCAHEGIRLVSKVYSNMDTSVNVVLVHENGERSFITNPKSSLRKLSKADAEAIMRSDAFDECRIFCLASMFVSPELNVSDMQSLFAFARQRGKIVCADSTRRKNGETLQDVAGALSQLDFFFPNAEEAQVLTESQSAGEAAEKLVRSGVRNAVVKCGADGCLIANANEVIRIPAYKTHCVDTTGAGDTFSAAFQAGLLEGRDLRECGAFACAAASVCIEKLGATTEDLHRTEIERRMREILKNCK